MDARQVLGVGARASRTDVRAAARRLSGALSGADERELHRLVDAAARALTEGRTTVSFDLDPHRILGVRTDASEDDVHAAYRRMARRVHPDSGGTDELFRIVAAAHDAVTRPAPAPWSATSTPPSTADPWLQWRARMDRGRAPGPPPPPKPWRPPPPEQRPAPPGWRAWATLLGNAGLLAAAGVLLVALGRVNTLGTVLAIALAAGSWYPVRSVLQAIARTAIVLWGARLRVPSDADPESFLSDNCLDVPVGREREDVLYGRYAAWCRGRRADPVAPWVFVERLRAVGLLFVKASAWESGMWVGIRLR